MSRRLTVREMRRKAEWLKVVAADYRKGAEGRPPRDQYLLSKLADHCEKEASRFLRRVAPRTPKER